MHPLRLSIEAHDAELGYDPVGPRVAGQPCLLPRAGPREITGGCEVVESLYELTRVLTHEDYCTPAETT